MQNEPESVVTYESCFWTPAQIDTRVANNSSILTTKLIMPESRIFNTSFSDPALSDPSAVRNISIVAGHISPPSMTLLEKVLPSITHLLRARARTCG